MAYVELAMKKVLLVHELGKNMYKDILICEFSSWCISWMAHKSQFENLVNLEYALFLFQIW